MKSFAEYLNARGIVVEKPKTDEVPDYDGPTPLSPEKNDNKGKNWDVSDVTPKDAPKPYATSKEDAKVSKEKGLGEIGDKNLVYEPDTKITKTEGFLQKTSKLDTSSFVQYMIENCGCGQVDGDEESPSITAYTTGKIFPHPPEALKYVSHLCGKNDNLLSNMVMEFKKSGILSKLIKSLMEHPETFEELTGLLGDEEDGPKRCMCLAKAMHGSYEKFMNDQDSMYETVAPPIGLEDDEEEEEESDEDQSKDIDGSVDYDDFDDSAEDLDDLDSLGDEEESEEEPSEESPENDMEPTEDPTQKPKRLKKKFAHDNLINAMNAHEPMANSMKSYMRSF